MARGRDQYGGRWLQPVSGGRRADSGRALVPAGRDHDPVHRKRSRAADVPARGARAVRASARRRLAWRRGRVEACGMPARGGPRARRR